MSKRAKKKSPANPLVYWTFWRRVRDSNPRFLLGTQHFECCTFDHSDNSPCLFSSGFLSRNLLKNSLERKQERRQKIFDFEIFCVEEYQGESGGRNSQLLPKFRVSPVMTTSIPLLMQFMSSARPKFYDFECRTFDLSDNSPYISSVIPAPEECKKNTQERYEIVKSEPAQSLVRRTFSADEMVGASKNFKSVPL